MRKVSASSREARLEEARLAREQRQRDRAAATSVLTVQSFVRGRRTAREQWNQQRVLFDKRVADLDKVKRVLAARTPPFDFVVPPKTLFPMVRQFCCFAARGRAANATEDAATRLPAICALIAKSAAQRKLDGNVVVLCADPKLRGVARTLARLCLASIFLPRPSVDVVVVDAKVQKVLEILTGDGDGCDALLRAEHADAAAPDTDAVAALRTRVRAAVETLHGHIRLALLTPAPPGARSRGSCGIEVVEALRRQTLAVKPIWKSKPGRCIEREPLTWALALIESDASGAAQRAFAARVLSIPTLTSRITLRASQLLGESRRFTRSVRVCAALSRSSSARRADDEYGCFWQAQSLAALARCSEYAVLRRAGEEGAAAEVAITFVDFLSAALSTLPSPSNVTRAVPRDVRDAIEDVILAPSLARVLVGALFPVMTHAATVEALFGGVFGGGPPGLDGGGTTTFGLSDGRGGGRGGGGGGGGGRRGAPRSFGDLVRSSPWARRLLGLEAGAGADVGAGASASASAVLTDTSGTARALAAGARDSAAPPRPAARSPWSLLGNLGAKLGLSVAAPAPPVAVSARSASKTRSRTAAGASASKSASRREQKSTSSVALPSRARVEATVGLLSNLVSRSGEDHSLLNVLAFSTTLAPWLWACFARDLEAESSSGGGGGGWLSAFGLGGATGPRSMLAARCGGDCAISLWCRVCSHAMLVSDDLELQQNGFPLPLHALRAAIPVLRKHFLELLARAQRESSTTVEEEQCRAALSRLLRQLFERSCRNPRFFGDEESGRGGGKRKGGASSDDAVWLAPAPFLSHLGRNNALLDAVLREAPFAVPLRQRLEIFSQRLSAARVAHQGPPGPQQRRKDVVIHRDRDVFREAYHQVTTIGSSGGMRDVFRVQFITAEGRRESGIDMGGLFKDLWTQVSAVAFEPNYGLWTVSITTASLYPRLSLATGVMGSGVDNASMFLFLGRVLGKAVYEGITVQPRFSHFFLTKLLGKRNGLNDLATLDYDLYKNLLFLKTYDGDIADLCLDFSVTEEDCGVTRVVDLRPGGRSIEVTRSNRLRYILLVADHHLNKRIKVASDAFVRGFHQVVPVAMLRWFSPAELQTLISGPDGPIDVDELKASARYSGGYTSRSVTVQRFWKALTSMDHDERKMVVRFVTGCERAVSVCVWGGGASTAYSLTSPPLFLSHSLPCSRR